MVRVSRGNRRPATLVAGGAVLLAVAGCSAGATEGDFGERAAAAVERSVDTRVVVGPEEAREEARRGVKHAEQRASETEDSTCWDLVAERDALLTEPASHLVWATVDYEDLVDPEAGTGMVVVRQLKDAEVRARVATLSESADVACDRDGDLEHRTGTTSLDGHEVSVVEHVRGHWTAGRTVSVAVEDVEVRYTLSYDYPSGGRSTGPAKDVQPDIMSRDELADRAGELVVEILDRL